jgi:hypothetical protein
MAAASALDLIKEVEGWADSPEPRLSTSTVFDRLCEFADSVQFFFDHPDNGVRLGTARTLLKLIWSNESVVHFCMQKCDFTIVAAALEKTRMDLEMQEIMGLEDTEEDLELEKLLVEIMEINELSMSVSSVDGCVVEPAVPKPESAPEDAQQIRVVGEAEVAIDVAATSMLVDATRTLTRQARAGRITQASAAGSSLPDMPATTGDSLLETSEQLREATAARNGLDLEQPVAGKGCDCVVCMASEAVFVVKTCGHLAVCKICRRKMVHKQLVLEKKVGDDQKARCALSSRELQQTAVACPMCRTAGTFVKRQNFKGVMFLPNGCDA